MNLYPFTETVASGASPDECVEQIDIGGPAMVRAAAKNHPSVAVVVDPARYADVLTAVAAGGFTLAERQKLAAAAFRHTASYDIAVASWMGNVLAPGRRQRLPDLGRRPAGSGPTCCATARTRTRAPRCTAGFEPGLAHAEQLHGKAMSYNNYVDTDAAWRAAHDHADPCVAIIKHANPCGIAVGADIASAHRKAHACDPISAFGGVIAANREVDLTMAEQVAEVFTEVVVAPSFTDDAVRGADRRRRTSGCSACRTSPAPGAEMRPISGGLLLQVKDRLDAPGDDPTTWTLATGEPLDAAGLDDLVFAWRAVRAVKSNAILLAHDRATVGVGMGQVNRVDSARLAVARAGERAAGSVAASDAFFPFADGLQVLLDAGRARRRPAGRVGAGRGGRRRGGGGRRAAVPDRHPPLRALMARSPARPAARGRRRGRGRGLRPRRLVGRRALRRHVHPLPVRRRRARGARHPALRVRAVRAHRRAHGRRPAPRVGVPVLPVRPGEAVRRRLGGLQAHRLAVPRAPICGR